MNHQELTEYFLSFNRYGFSAEALLEQKTEYKMDHSKNKPILYFSNVNEGTKKIVMPIRFDLSETIGTKLYSLRIRCIVFYTRANSLLIVNEMSSRVQFYSINTNKMSGFIDLNDIVPSSTSKITAMTICEVAHLMAIASTDRAMFVVNLDPDNTRVVVDTLDLTVNSKTMMYFSPELA